MNNYEVLNTFLIITSLCVTVFTIRNTLKARIDDLDTRTDAIELFMNVPTCVRAECRNLFNETKTRLIAIDKHLTDLTASLTEHMSKNGKL